MTDKARQIQEQALLLAEADWTKFWAKGLHTLSDVIGMGMTMQHYKEHLQIRSALGHNHEAVLTGDLIDTNAAATTDEDEQEDDDVWQCAATLEQMVTGSCQAAVEEEVSRRDRVAAMAAMAEDRPCESAEDLVEHPVDVCTDNGRDSQVDVSDEDVETQQSHTLTGPAGMEFRTFWDVDGEIYWGPTPIPTPLPGQRIPLSGQWCQVADETEPYSDQAEPSQLSAVSVRTHARQNQDCSITQRSRSSPKQIQSKTNDS